MPLTPFLTFTALLGRQDGEFYADGLAVYIAVGWWMILCSVLLLLEWSRRRRRTRAA
jgi:hypothetical protein